MSEIPQEKLSYRTVVAEYFLGLRGSGLLLSPLDEELVATWERRGLPVAVVCRGLRRGMEQQLEERVEPSRLPRALRAYRFAVEEEWRAYRYGRVGESPAAESEDLAARERLEAARSFLGEAARADGARRDIYLEAQRALSNVDIQTHRTPVRSVEREGQSLTLATVEQVLIDVDGVLLTSWLRTLPHRERVALGGKLRSLASPRPAWVRLDAHRRTLRLHLLDVARRAGLRCLRGSV